MIDRRYDEDRRHDDEITAADIEACIALILTPILLFIALCI